MRDLVARIRSRLEANAYPSEAAVSHGIVHPLLAALGWDASNPAEVAPEYATGRGTGAGRVDFALCRQAGKPAVFIEVKAVGRALDGDRQLFEYAFHDGVPLAILTDGREWNFFMPGAQGSLDDRRVHQLALDQRPVDECERILTRYLEREAVRTGAAFENARADYDAAMRRRDAERALPQAWADLCASGEELLVELMTDRVAAVAGVSPSAESVLVFLRSLAPRSGVALPRGVVRGTATAGAEDRTPNGADVTTRREPASLTAPRSGRAQSFRLFGVDGTAPNASEAFVAILRQVAARDPSRLPSLAAAVAGRSRNHIGRSPEEIYPRRPDLARADSVCGDWLVGLNISNRDKARILRAAAEVYGLTWGRDIDVSFPNE